MFNYLLDKRGILLADGAMGSNLFEFGLQTGDSPEIWNSTRPNIIAKQYQSFIDAGSDILLTNTFGGNKYRLHLHGAESRVQELNAKSAEIARKQVTQSDREIIIGGSMGPTGEIFQPVGLLTIEEAANAFEEQARALKEGGVDLLWIETMSSKEEVQAAVTGCARVNLPMVTTFSIDTNGRTMMGVSPLDILILWSKLNTQPCGVGVNCGLGASEAIAAVINILYAANSMNVDPVIIVKANCGVPQYVDGKIVYSGTAEIMADYARMAVDAGAKVIGGCCGTTPAHVKSMREALDHHTKSSSPPKIEEIEKRLGEISNGAKAQLRGEMSIEAGIKGDRVIKKRAKRRK